MRWEVGIDLLEKFCIIGYDTLLVTPCPYHHIYYGHGLFLQFFGFFRSVEDLFTSAYYAGNQAVKQEASH